MLDEICHKIQNLWYQSVNPGNYHYYTTVCLNPSESGLPTLKTIPEILATEFKPRSQVTMVNGCRIDRITTLRHFLEDYNTVIGCKDKHTEEDLIK